MGLINHFTLALITLSCLFSFSSSHDAPSPLAEDIVTRELLQKIISNPPLPSGGAQLEGFRGDVDPALQQICGNTFHPVDCILTAMPFLDEKTPVESLSVLKAEIQATVNQTKDALAKATRLAGDPTTPTNSASVLRTCIGVYNDILASDQKALEAISKGNFDGLSTDFTTNAENLLGCDEAFIKAKVKSPMEEVNARLAKTIGNAMTISLVLAH